MHEKKMYGMNPATQAASVKGLRGFTLVELLVVISIIALLVSILMPALSRAREQAQSLLCSTRLKNQHFIHIMYTEEDERGSFFRGWLWFRRMVSYQSTTNVTKATEMTFKMFECPTSLRYGENDMSNAYSTPGNREGYWRSGFDEADPPYVEGGHAFNSLMNQKWEFNGDGTVIAANKSSRISGHRRYSETAMTIDSYGVYWSPKDIGDGKGLSYDSLVSYRHHNKSANVCWLDGHVSHETEGRNFQTKDMFQNY